MVILSTEDCEGVSGENSQHPKSFSESIQSVTGNVCTREGTERGYLRASLWFINNTSL